MLFESLESCLDRSRRLGQRRSSAMPECHKAEAMQAFADDAVKKGARVVNAGGGTACETLYFPAVVYPVRPGVELYTKEQFGPVVPVCAYQDEQEFL